MNSVESSTVVYSRLASLDPESASKIMGFILIHGPSEADMMSLAVAPDAILQQLINKGKNYSKILTSNPSALHSPTSSHSPRLAASPRFLSNGFAPGSNLSSPMQIPTGNNSSTGGNSSKASPSYAAVVNGNGSCGPSPASSSSQVHNDSGGGGGEGGGEEYAAVPEEQFKTDDVGLGSPRLFHKRSLSVSDAYGGGGSDEMNGLGFGWRSSMAASSPGKFDGFFEQEILRSRATQQQRLALASQIMSGNSFPYNKYLSDSPRSMAAAMMMGEELHKLGQLRHDLSDFALMGCSSGSRQIYLTFPADSTFREEDVSNYFSIYGPVQDVRIPYQQKRMFGFVTFVHPETVKIILAKGNPHFVCDSRVLVKPYKEKGKVEKKHLMTQQQLERGDHSCSSPHGVDIRDFDVRVGPRMFYNNTQDLLMRRKIEEQAEFQKALDMQSRKLASLQLLDLNNLPRRHPFSHNHNLSPAAAISSPTHHPLLSPNHMRSMDAFNQEAFEENVIAPTLSLPPNVLANRQMSLEVLSNANNPNKYLTGNTNMIHKLADSANTESIDLVLPDTLDDTAPSMSPALSRHSILSSAMLATNENGAVSSSPFSSNSSTKDSSACVSNAAPPKSRFLDGPRLGCRENESESRAGQCMKKPKV